MTTTKKPWQMGKKARAAILGYLERNPQDDVTSPEIAQRCSLKQVTAAKYLSLLAGEGILERVSVYRLRVSASTAHGSPGDTPTEAT